MIVAAVAGAVLFPAPIMLDVLKKAAALTDVLLTKVMWSLWVGGSIASGDHSSFVSDKGIDERPLLRVSVEALSGRNQPLASSPLSSASKFWKGRPHGHRQGRKARKR